MTKFFAAKGSNLIVIRHCHDEKTALDLVLEVCVTKYQDIEDQNEGKLSRSGLKTSRAGNSLAEFN